VQRKNFAARRDERRERQDNEILAERFCDPGRVIFTI
jgi:hypothetical protein